ncbi:thiamine phosphate synthase [uncultured Mucilaginibacter sp.]|uniref:thiamine phosphate synthase n=1 Tax=uncultured Mucilaginibacter sp. TaxID=797541 RepID=UPI002609B6FE|nr:thiamine phosphate synthase [uncultured Mucilaginibacter sp.]
MIAKLQYISQENAEQSHLQAIKKALEAGCNWIQLRVKNQPEEKVLELALEAKKLCDAFSAKLIVNDHPEVALKAKADGLHLGLQDMPVLQARAIVGPEMMIGGTANTFEHVMQRVAEGVNYIGLGPFRFTKTKEKLSPILGLEGYKTIMQQMQEAQISLPIIAIGGIELEDIASIIQTGIYGVAVSGAITRAENPKETVQEMLLQTNLAKQEY